MRQVLKSVREEVLRGCKIVFTGIILKKLPAQDDPLWKMAEQLGAKCSTEMDPSVTHVVSGNPRTIKSQRAVKEKKFLVNQGWIEASNLLWKKQPEEKFHVIATKK